MALAGLLLVAAAAATGTRPHILFVVVDDVRMRVPVLDLSSQHISNMFGTDYISGDGSFPFTFLQLGWDDLGFRNGGQIKTPVIDTLASEGIVLTHMYTMPVCSPARTSMNTGR